MRCYLLALTLLLGGAACSSGPPTPVPHPSVRIGLRYPPLPANIVDEGGWLVGPSPGISYSLSIVSSPEGRAVWLSRFTHRDPSGKAHWELRQVATLPRLQAGFTVATVDCSLDGQPDAQVIALGRWVDDSLRDVQGAWVARPAAERIDTVAIHRVACFFVGDRD